MKTRKSFSLKVPGSSSNLGSGFDVLSIALGVYLKIDIEHSLPPVSCEGLDDIDLSWSSGVDGEDSRLHDPKYNLLTLSAAFLASQCGKKLPKMKLTCCVDIPVGCGLGSSGASIVAGVIIANEVCGIGLSRQDLLQYAIVIEGFGDNVTASMLGGFIICPKICPLLQYIPGAKEYLDNLRKGGECEKVFTYCPKIQPVKNLEFLSVPVRSDIKFVTVSPCYKMDTSEARRLIPSAYPISDVVNALNNVAKLIVCLSGDLPLEQVHSHLASALKDPIHQPYRAKVIPGLSKILNLEFPPSGNIIGIYLSGAGPSIQVLSRNEDLDGVRNFIVDKWAEFAHSEGSRDFSARGFVSSLDTKGVVIA